MSELRRVLVRLSKDYQVVEVEVANIDNDLSYELEKEWALNEARTLINQVGTAPKVVQNKNQYQQDYKRDEQPQNSSPSSKVNTRFAKGKQIGLLQQGVDKGLFSVEEVNAIANWDETQTFIQRVFASGRK